MRSAPGSHPLLAQLPLTVSPFLSLPTATTLPYTYKSLPSTLPPSCIDPPPPPAGSSGAADPSAGSSSDSSPPKAQYVISEWTGRAAHPDDIIASCEALQAQLDKTERDAKALVDKWLSGIRERDLAEKRRVAPGWLDAEEGGRLLVPERSSQGRASQTHGDGGAGVGGLVIGVQATLVDGGGTRGGDEGEELDRAFGSMAVK